MSEFVGVCIGACVWLSECVGVSARVWGSECV